MSVLRLLGIIVIFGCTSIAWVLLGTSVQIRTDDLDRRLSAEMASDWGPPVLAQTSPYWVPEGKRVERSEGAPPSASAIVARIEHEHRDKGLLWYSTFKVHFEGTYSVALAAAGSAEAARGGTFVLPLPNGATSYEALTVELDGKAVPTLSQQIGSGRIALPVARDANHTVVVRYATRGQNAWIYSPGNEPAREDRDKDVVISPGPLTELPNFSLTVETDFHDIDYPKGTMFPTDRARPRPQGGGMIAQWHSDNLITSKSAGIAMPTRPNAGPIASRMSFFAPVSLLFFFTVLFTVVVLKGIRLHPMHYLFIAGGFFAFHILLAYLADVVNIHAAFWVSAAVSVALVVSYMRLAAGVRFALTYTALAQAVFLVGFSYAFFWQGRTGLAVTIGAVLTLFVLMQATGRVDWYAVFGGRPEDPSSAAPPLPTACQVAEPVQHQQ